MYAMYIPLNTGLHWVLCEVVLPRSSTSAGEQYPTGKLKIYDSLHARKSTYKEVMDLLIEHLGYVWALRGYADQRDGDEGKAGLDAPMGKTAVSWKYLGVAQHNEMPRQVNMVDCELFTCKAVENLWWTACHWWGAAMALDAAGSTPAKAKAPARTAAGS
jgi:Ulp1 family protease